MQVYAAFVYIFLYAPIALIVFFSFNSGRYAMDWQGFSLQWYSRAFSNELIVNALLTSLTIAFSTAVLSSIIGTLAALGLERMKGWPRQVFDALIYIAIMVPSVVIGISTLIAFVTVFDTVNPLLESVAGLRAQMGTWTVIAAHVLFNIAVVILIARAAYRYGSQPHRGVRGSLRDPPRHFPPGGAPPAPALDRRRVPARLHVLV
jgi:spermidine/putrescine transport system permease protein